LNLKWNNKGNPYESIKISDSKVDMKDMAAVFSKGDDDGFTDVLIGPERIELRVKKRFSKGGLVRSGKPKIAKKDGDNIICQIEDTTNKLEKCLI
jgi:hypothetical protein